MITNQSYELLEEYTHYKNKLMPYPGGTLNQPRGYIQAMAIIDNYLVKENGSNS